MFSENRKFNEWRAELEKRGVSIRWLWSAKSHPKMRYDDIALASFYGDGFQPSESTAVIQDHEAKRRDLSHDVSERGFGVWFQSPHSLIVDETIHIAGPRA